MAHVYMSMYTLCLCARVCMCISVCVHMHMESKSQRWCVPYFLRRSHSLILELIHSTRVHGQQAPECCFHLPEARIACTHDAQLLMQVLHVCMASTLSTEPAPQPSIHFSQLQLFPECYYNLPKSFSELWTDIQNPAGNFMVLGKWQWQVDLQRSCPQAELYLLDW